MVGTSDKDCHLLFADFLIELKYDADVELTSFVLSKKKSRRKKQKHPRSSTIC